MNRHGSVTIVKVYLADKSFLDGKSAIIRIVFQKWREWENGRILGLALTIPGTTG
jgi:hypothetical protein